MGRKYFLVCVVPDSTSAIVVRTNFYLVTELFTTVNKLKTNADFVIYLARNSVTFSDVVKKYYRYLQNAANYKTDYNSCVI